MNKLRKILLMLCVLLIGFSPQLLARADTINDTNKSLKEVSALSKVFYSDGKMNNSEGWVMIITRCFQDFYLVYEYENGDMYGLNTTSDTVGDEDGYSQEYGVNHLVYNEDDTMTCTPYKVDVTDFESIKKNCFLFKKTEGEYFDEYSTQGVDLGVDPERFPIKLHVYDGATGKEIGSSTNPCGDTGSDDPEHSPTGYDEDSSIIQVSDPTYIENNAAAFVTMSWDFSDIAKHYQDAADSEYMQFITMSGDDGTVIDSKYLTDKLTDDNDTVGKLTVKLLTNTTYHIHFHTSFRDYYADVAVDKLIKPVNVNIVDEEEEKVVKTGKKPIVTFEGIPKQIETGKGFWLDMLTNKKCQKQFDNESDIKFSTKSKFLITQNGRYTYEATDKDGRIVTGTVDINCFVDPDGLNPYDSADDPSIPTRSNLPQTGSTSWVSLMVLGSIAMVFGVVIFLKARRKEVRSK